MASIDPVRRFGERLTGRTSDDDKPVSSTQARPPPQVTSIDRTDVCFHHLAGVSPRFRRSVSHESGSLST